jgi:formylglycine-generating enzyme required for sulfatase activity
MPGRSYADFDLWVSSGRSGYPLRATGFPHGEARGTLRWSFEIPAPGSGSPGLRNLTPLAPASAGTEPKVFGEKLFQAVFKGKIDRLFTASRAQARAESRPLRLRLHLSAVPALSRLPWEYLFDPERRLFLAHEISIVRYLESPDPCGALQVEPPLRIVVIRALPADCEPLAIEEEWNQIRTALRRRFLPGRARVETLKSSTFEALQERLEAGPCHVLHFIGHGALVSGKGMLLFEGEDGKSAPVDALRLSTLLRDRGVRLVVLNSCYGAHPSWDDPWIGVAQDLVHKGIPAVVAMQSVITDRAALRFSQRFYRSLAENATIDTALSAARRSLFFHGDNAEWGTPVLYTQSPDGNLFDVPPPSVGERVRVATVRGAWLAALLLAAWAAWWFWYRDRRAPASPECPSPPGTDIRFVLIPKGKFMMGANRKGERPIHGVEITRSFCMGQFEVTERQWAQVMTGKPDPPTEPLDNRPKTEVSLDDVHQFLARLNQRAGRPRFRLPYEAEWEYAARAGSTTPYSFGKDPSELYKYGHCLSKAGRDDYGNVALVGQYQPNGWNLYDMYGNVWEWVEDYYGDYPAGAVQDPKGPAEGTSRVRRGGAYDSSVAKCRSAYRDPWPPVKGSYDLGFRIVEDLQRRW